MPQKPWNSPSNSKNLATKQAELGQALNEMKDLKKKLKLTFDDLSKRTYLNDFGKYIGMQIMTWMDYRSTLHVTNPEHEKCTKLIDQMISMMTTQAQDEFKK